MAGAGDDTADSSREKEALEVNDDEQPGQADLERIPSMRPAFAKDGTITAANASSISDGASALLLMPESRAASEGVTPLARIHGHATFSRHPSEFTLAPVGAIERLLEKTGWAASDVDLFEINEAFAVGHHDRHGPAQPACGEGEHPRRRLCPGPPHWLHRIKADCLAASRAATHRRQARHCVTLHRRGRGDCRGY